jgi:sn-1 stearoyl-lipid 9-desaturase
MDHVTAWITWCEDTAGRTLRLERGCNVGLLVHVVLYYVLFAALVCPGLIGSIVLRGPLWLILLFLNYSLTIGVLHMHAHRPLFTSRLGNRILDLLLCVPSLLTSTEMIVFHVGQHHRYENAPGDPSTTLGYERGWRAVRYWVLFGLWVRTVTFRAVFGSRARPAYRAFRRRFALELAVGTLAVASLTAAAPLAATVCWYVPYAITHVTSGYFAWLTHAPAGEPRTRDGSINTVNNVLGFFVFNQGYHQVHHAHPGIHWSEIPDHLDVLLEVDSRYIVSYWVTLNTAWRILVPDRFREPAYGEDWKRRYGERRRQGTVRLHGLRHFAWI